jgi:hypothetical protein
MQRLSTATFALAVFVCLALLGFGIGVLFAEDFDSGSDRLIFGVLVVGGGVLVGLGLLAFRQPWLSAGLLSIGALAGALGIFWTILMPLLAVALLVMSVLRARRARA